MEFEVQQNYDKSMDFFVFDGNITFSVTMTEEEFKQLKKVINKTIGRYE